ncbi:MAG: type IV pilus modification protein PilV [Gammaproteobacteria bacterium]|nr:MAG: type IV pilus modification protein PilV [Gammaproteobacteria bacterium]
MGTKFVGKSGVSGLTLVEVLVALLILSAGVAGVAATQTVGLRTVQSSYFRTQADFMLREMADRIRANADQRDLYAFGFGAALPVINDCIGGCAGYDSAQWLNNIQNTLPLGDASIQVDGTGQVVMTILWQDKIATNGASFCANNGNNLMYCMTLKIET